MRELHTEIEIGASTERVWQLLADFPGYPAWNPFIPQAAGRVEQGQHIEVQLHPPGGRPVTIKPMLTCVKPQQELRWLGKLFISGLFDGEHIFTIEPLGPNRVKFIQREEFRGLLVGLVLKLVGNSTRQGFEAMNVALKAEAEKQQPL